MNETNLARSLRFIAVRSYLEAGHITRDDAVELLRGCLSPDDESTRVDDAHLLDLSDAEVAAALADTDLEVTE